MGGEMQYLAIYVESRVHFVAFTSQLVDSMFAISEEQKKVLFLHVQIRLSIIYTTLLNMGCEKKSFGRTMSIFNC